MWGGTGCCHGLAVKCVSYWEVEKQGSPLLVRSMQPKAAASFASRRLGDGSKIQNLVASHIPVPYSDTGPGSDADVEELASVKRAVHEGGILGVATAKLLLAAGATKDPVGYLKAHARPEDREAVTGCRSKHAMVALFVCLCRVARHNATKRKARAETPKRLERAAGPPPTPPDRPAKKLALPPPAPFPSTEPCSPTLPSPVLPLSPAASDDVTVPDMGVAKGVAEGAPEKDFYGGGAGMGFPDPFDCLDDERFPFDVFNEDTFGWDLS